MQVNIYASEVCEGLYFVRVNKAALPLTGTEMIELYERLGEYISSSKALGKKHALKAAG